ncbi:MAG: 50S ribosomal protein L33 [Elusimicrobia bacterium]|nr:50S ribosomal protein L33 [Elusimicrobiota bacterium]
MAKRDTIIQHLECTECKRRNYTLRRNRVHRQDKLELQKHCRFCGQHRLHKTVKG